MRPLRPTPGTKECKGVKKTPVNQEMFFKKKQVYSQRSRTHDSRVTTIRSEGPTPTVRLQNLEHGLPSRAAWKSTQNQQETLRVRKNGECEEHQT
ncbi:hypothetical protein NDU88_001685 [Pleurodeles waltl]|uniref:Uncharacterized protein n=1 Tax=Pleurodeles waltl TaxID=8319 RepID=A0AAV7U7X1_PLEWA|nr:hypothetical protein NDU88_001685 [Pleurodeles waltl]